MHFDGLDLNLLVALDALLSEQSVTRAASRLCVTQPAVSVALQKLRVQFSDQVLERVGRRMELTPFAQELALPLIAGTEMNSPGQKLVDDFDAPELAPLKSAFREGAAFLHGHTMLQRARTLGCSSAWAQSHFPARRERNAFYRQVGERAPQGCAIIRQMRALPANPAPEQVLSGMH